MTTIPDPAPLEVSVEDASSLIRTHPEGVQLIDVREPFEIGICQVEGATLIPMRRIPEALPDLPRDRLLLILCHVGGRSLRVTEYLRRQGFTSVSNVAGGIDAWSERIDPRLPRY